MRRRYRRRITHRLPNSKRPPALVREIGRMCLIVPTDVGDSAQVNAMAAAAIKEFGQVDILINNAGIGEDSFGKPIETNQR